MALPVRSRTFAVTATVAYTILAVAWILLGDLLLRLLVADRAQYQGYPSPRWVVFALLSAGFVYWLAHRERARWMASHAELLASRHELETAVRVAGVGYWTVDTATDQVSWSAEMYRIFRLDPGSPPSTFHQLPDRTHAEDRASFVAALGTFQQRETAVLNHTHRIIRPNGEVRWVQLRGERVFEADGVERVLGTMQDITDEKAAEMELRLARERLTALAKHLEVAREEERKRLAMDIHDEIGASLVGIRLSFALLERGPADSEEQQSRLRSLGHELEGLIGKVRHLSADLRPVELDELGLMAALTGLAADWRRRCAWQLDIMASNDDPLAGIDPERGIHVYRIVQEAFTNISRHASASRVRLVVRQNGNYLELAVEDDGRGPEQAPPGRSSFGIMNMQHRAELLGGMLIIEPGEAGGTSVRLSIPLQYGAPRVVP